MIVFCFFFFFQAEDGIRDVAVTGVQTCALPISNYLAVPSVVFTVPPLAAVGLSEQSAREQGLQFRTNHQETSGWYSSRRVGEKCSGFKVLVEEGSSRIIGAHLLGHHVEEVINLFALAIRSGLTVAHFTEMMFAYPTHASDISYMV